jgi:hypothetical protein
MCDIHYREDTGRCLVNTRRFIASAAVVGILVLPGGSGAEPSESKAALIKELIEISGVSGMAQQMLDQHGYIELMRLQPEYQPMMELAVSEQLDLSEEDRQQLWAQLSNFERFAERFYELFTERVDFPKIIESVYQPLYEKYFDVGDLEEMVAFYRTPVGRKTIEVMPSLMQEAGLGVDQMIRPQSIALLQEIVAEERAKLKD